MHAFVFVCSRAIDSGDSIWVLVAFKRGAHFRKELFSICCLGCLQFEQRHQERERRLRSLVFVHPVRMKAVSTTASYWVIESNLQIVLTKKPAEDTLGFLEPLSLFSQFVDLKAGRDCRTRLDRLLIESRLLISFHEETSRPNWHENLCIVAVLLCNKPFEGIHSGLDRALIVASPPRQNQGLR